MDGCELITSCNTPLRRSIYMDKGIIRIKCNDNPIDGASITKFLSDIQCAIQQHPSIDFGFVIDIGKADFIDKLTYVIFECIIYVVISEYNKQVQIKREMLPNKIINTGFKYSPVKLLCKTNGGFVPNRNIEFLKAFDSQEILGYHFRKIIKANEKESSPIFSKIMQDVAIFLNTIYDDKKCNGEVAEIVSELMGNASEHTNSDCLIDLDANTNYYSIVNEKKEKYYAINIAIINFANINLGDSLHHKMSTDTWAGLPQYESLKKAYINHKSFFDETYCEEDFYHICSFQDKISGRMNTSTTGGTGLTKLIHSMEKNTNKHLCYVLSGKEVLYFVQDFLTYNDDNWIGFNSSNNFICDRPDPKVISRSNFNMPGTAYNLTFVIKQEELA